MRLADRVISWLAGQPFEAYLVGGSVRDRILGRQRYDLDVVVAGDGLALSRRLADCFGGAYYPLDEARGTGRVILARDQAKVVVDVAQLRGSDLAEDLRDRDFTINALAIDTRQPDRVIDLVGGQSDLGLRLIRPVSLRSIANDPVRALRALRLAAELGFRLDQEAERQILRDGARLAQVSPERIRDELGRILTLVRSAECLVQMEELGLLGVVFPELESLRGVEQPPPHHLDLLAHSIGTVRMLEQFLENLQRGPLALLSQHIVAHLQSCLAEGRPRLVILKIAALLHDAGKPEARVEDGSGRVRFVGHEVYSEAITAQALRRLRFSGAEVRLGATIVRNHMRPLHLARQDAVTRRAVFRFFRDTGDAGVEIVLHAMADALATYSPGLSDRSAIDRLSQLAARMLEDYWARHAERIAPPRLLNGHDLLHEFGLEPGPLVGRLLAEVQEAQAAGDVRTRSEALKLARRLALKLSDGEAS